MKTLIVAAALAAAAGPAVAQQTKVGIKQGIPDTVRVMRSQLSPDQVRQLWAELNALIAQNLKNNELWKSEMRSSSRDEKRIQSLQDEMERIGWVLLPKQSEFVMACATLRHAEDDVRGTLGLQLYDSVHFVRIIDSEGGGSLTMVVSGPPKIAAIDPASPAGLAGIQMGDVLMSVNGRPLVDSVRFDELLTPGSIVMARVNRGGKDLDVTMKVVKKTSDFPGECNNAKQFNTMTPFSGPGGGGVITLPAPNSIDRQRLPSMPPGASIQLFMYSSSKALYGGATLQPLDDDWRGMSGLQGEGLLVTDLPDGSPAAVAGFKKFDLIKLVNNEPVASTIAFQKITRSESKLVFTVFNKALGTTRQITMTTRR